MTKMRKSSAWYALRRTLPTWSFEENLQELVRVLPRYRVDEVIVKVDTEEFSHGQPPLKWVQRYQKNLFRIKEAMQELGIVYSINPWITVGHNDRGRDSTRMLPGLRTNIGHDGTVCKVCACPLCSVWRDHVAKLWTLYAETEPHIIWIEDDIRTFNHRPVTFSCFCPLHMERFSRLVGRKVTREQLVSAILRPGRPHPWRKLYLDMQAGVMNDTVAFLAKTVHAVSPGTSMGLMSSGPRNHCMEGRDWSGFAAAMADGRPLYSRPPMGNYNEDSLRGFYYSHDSIKITRHCMPADTIEQTEVESVPFTQYSKSAVFTFIEMAISFAYGSHGVTMNLYDHCGTPLEREPVFGKMLAEKKRYLNALAERAQRRGKFAGVQILFHDKESYHRRLTPNAPYYALSADGDATMRALESHGVPTTYDDSKVVGVTGQTIRAFTDDQIRGLLSKGLLLDAAAACILAERGFGKQIGIRSIKEPRFLDDLGAFSAEEFFSPSFGGSDKKFLTLTVPGLGSRPNFSVLEPCKRARIISRIVDPDAKRHHVCMYAYENNLGGRVVVHAMDWRSAVGVPFNHTFRAEQLQGAVRWLSGGRTPIVVRGGAYPLAFRKDSQGETLLGLFNLTLDLWPYAEFEIATSRQVRRIEFLKQDGQWVRNKRLKCVRHGSCAIIRYDAPVSHDAPLMISVKWR